MSQEPAIRHGWSVWRTTQRFQGLCKHAFLTEGVELEAMCIETGSDEMYRNRRWRSGGYMDLFLSVCFYPADRITFRRTLYLVTALVAFITGLLLGLSIPVRIGTSLTPKNTSVSKGESKPREIHRVPAVAYRYEPNPRIVDGIFWADDVENELPKGFDHSANEEWRNYLKNSTVVKMEEGCGRMQNRLLTFEDGTRACCRYRQNTDQIQGELFSFYLGRLLGLNNLAPSALSVVQRQKPMWSKITAEMGHAQWIENRPVVLTKYVDDLLPAQIPHTLRRPSRKLHPKNVPDNRTVSVELAQWSDLIIFDYLIANLDRIVNNLYNLQWNPGMMDAPAHNLARHGGWNLLLFLDNESGLLHGYRLLDKYEPYHSTLLNALCIFRRPTVEAIHRLRSENILTKTFEEWLYREGDLVPGLPEASLKILADRLNRVYDQIEWCKKQYPS
ncbi:hypothetical protein GE061_014068 [Apolygus lucorum]|uniref:FAM20 C-terminal domain-containing protein n=1 Tax=Apolygus lucorum TaxID=248454 RepID=A0A8S9XTM9_APOLU|nr:hypothetical protein GE061_014068 [Apolygus lucorum]